jgi:Raf kinase inhibitor-like YbhB/YbcL family protein
MIIQITSPAFKDGDPIPKKYTCDAENVSPPLEWSDLPEGTKSVAIICDDPDAPIGTWVHWVLYGLSPTQSSLEERVPAKDVLPGDVRQGRNDFKRFGYGGPCPPPGKAHRYFFKIYALDVDTDLEPGASKKQLRKAMEGHILAQGQLMGTYQR